MIVDGEIKVLGDSYSGGFSCGLTMCESGTMERLRLKRMDDLQTEYISDDGLRLTITHANERNVTTVFSKVMNTGSTPVCLEMMTSFLIRDLHIDKIHRLQTCWSAEGKLKSESITDLHLERSWNGCAFRIEKFGNVGSMPVRKYFPFLAVEDQTTGIFTGIQLYCASSWQMEIKCRFKDTYTVCGGIADRDFGQWTKTLAPGETFIAPKAVIATGNSLEDVCDKLVKAQQPAISQNDLDMDIMFNEYCTTWGNPSFENVKKIADKIAGKGIKFLVIDSGWYGKSDNWWASVGDWTVNEERFKGGMKPIADYIRSKGMIPGLWFEMESVTSEAKYYNDTGLLVKKDGFPLTVANRRFWDMENPKAVEYLTKSVIGTLKDSGFGYLKVDYNDTMGMGVDGPEGPGENLRKKVEASRNFFKKIAEEIPGIVIENCSSGGHRLEPSMMEVASQASFSDAHETKAIPIIAANLHRVIMPRQSQIWAVMRAEDTDERIFYSVVSTFLGRMCLSGDIYNMSEHQWKLIEEGISFYRNVSHIIKDGKTVKICVSTESYNNPTGEQIVIRTLKDEGLLIFHRFEDSSDFDTVLKKNGLSKENFETIGTYGKAESDFSAMAVHFKVK